MKIENLTIENINCMKIMMLLQKNFDPIMEWLG